MPLTAISATGTVVVVVVVVAEEEASSSKKENRLAWGLGRTRGVVRFKLEVVRLVFIFVVPSRPWLELATTSCRTLDIASEEPRGW